MAEKVVFDSLEDLIRAGADAGTRSVYRVRWRYDNDDLEDRFVLASTQQAAIVMVMSDVLQCEASRVHSNDLYAAAGRVAKAALNP